MINDVGYTEDGQVWIDILFKHENQPVKMVVTMNPEQAEAVSKSLTEASSMASKFADKIIGSNGNDGVTQCQKPQEP